MMTANGTIVASVALRDRSLKRMRSRPVDMTTLTFSSSRMTIVRRLAGAVYRRWNTMISETGDAIVGINLLERRTTTTSTRSIRRAMMINTITDDVVGAGLGDMKMKRIVWTDVAVAVLQPLTTRKDAAAVARHITTRGEAMMQRPDAGGHVAPTLLKSKTITAGVVGKLVIAATQTTSMIEEVLVARSLKRNRGLSVLMSSGSGNLSVDARHGRESRDSVTILKKSKHGTTPTKSTSVKESKRKAKRRQLSLNLPLNRRRRNQPSSLSFPRCPGVTKMMQTRAVAMRKVKQATAKLKVVAKLRKRLRSRKSTSCL